MRVTVMTRLTPDLGSDCLLPNRYEYDDNLEQRSRRFVEVSRPLLVLEFKLLAECTTIAAVAGELIVSTLHASSM